MKTIHTKIIPLLKPYLITVILFVIVGYLFKTAETFLFFKYQDSISFLAIMQSFFNITVAFCLYAVVILPVYLLIGLLKQNPAQIVVSLLFAILISLEIGLYMYYKFTGVLMGAELIVRPVSEIFATIRNSSNIIIDIVAITGVITLFITLPFLLKKIKVFKSNISLVAGFFTLGILSLGTLLYQNISNRNIDNYVESKSYYFFSAIGNYLMNESGSDFVFEGKEKVERIEKNDPLFKEYAKLYPNRTIPDLDYPMERSNTEIPDVLSPFFEKSEKQPNIVIVIVESLGSYLMGEKGKNVSFTPFLDSLANTGLYWKNCLATTPRTFGILPAVIGSVPHGIRGFQFGIMPKHHSLFSILKSNQYFTNFFHGGDINFDSMLDFLSAQEPDHIDNFKPQLRAFQKKDQANYWALYDHILFSESFKYLNNNLSQKPQVNAYLTLTTHEPFYGGDKALNSIYEPKTEEILSKLNPDLRKQFLRIKDILVPFTYLDDCMRAFFYQYSQQPDFENTIFIITGDHSYGIHKNDLAHYSVPLIIWSPLLKAPKSFPNIVSHWAITPSIISFLQNNYNLSVPGNISWSSDGLDTASVFNPSETVLFLSYERIVNAMVYHQYFYEYPTKKLYKIDVNLDLTVVNDEQLLEDIQSKFNTLKYINNYVYHNNNLIKSDLHPENEYKLIKVYENHDVIVCKTPDTIPSIHGIDSFEILPVQKIKGQYNKIKIKLTADIIINDMLFQDQHMNLNFICTGNDYQYISKENITKYIEDDDIICDNKYELSIEKEMIISELKKINVSICVTSNEKNENWRPNKRITLSSIRVLIFGK